MRQTPELPSVAGIGAAPVPVAGCTPGGDPPPSTNVTAAAPILLNGSMNGARLAVPLDTTLTLELAENPSTGYS